MSDITYKQLGDLLPPGTEIYHDRNSFLVSVHLPDGRIDTFDDRTPLHVIADLYQWWGLIPRDEGLYQ